MKMKTEQNKIITATFLSHLFRSVCFLSKSPYSNEY